MAVEVTKRYFTVDDFYSMAETGTLSIEERVELIEGEIVTMSPIGSRHSGCVKRLNAFLTQALGNTVIISVQDPISLNIYSEPQPDIAVLRLKANFYSDKHPSPSEVLLLIEVADTSIGYDRETKVPLYARAGIPELWLVDLVGEVVTQYVEPIRGEYRRSKRAKRGDYIRGKTIRDLIITVDEVLGSEAVSGSK